MNFQINWFPGHMAQTLRLIDQELKICDAIIYVLDARCPRSCLNPEFRDFVGRKPVLYLLNKTDLAPTNAVSAFRSAVTAPVIGRNSVKSGGRDVVVKALENLLADRIQNKLNHGIKKILRVAVIGVTNCGKSTFINNMTDKAKTQTGNRPGVTRTKQWVAITNNLWLLDTPGTLWPALTNPAVARNLAYTGAIKDDVLDLPALCSCLLADLEKLQPGVVAARYGATDFAAIALARGCRQKGGEIDSGRAAKLILGDFRTGKLGKFNLDALL